MVIVTGDFHDFIDRTDFSLAKEFLRQLIDTLGLDIRKDLFVVPGNHDGVTVVDEKKFMLRQRKEIPWSWNKLG